MTKKKLSVLAIALMLLIALLVFYIETVQPDEMLRNMLKTVVMFLAVLMWLCLNVIMFNQDK